MKLFSKDNDYNLILEKILDSKYFSSNSKSLLLSMVYKIENFYTDYQKVKNINKTKEEFLEKIIDTIKKYCDNIKLVEPDSKDAKILKDNNVLALTNERERSILSYPTEIALLYAISDEFHQLFSSGRTAKVMDVGIDSAGVIFGIFIVYVIIKLYKTLKTKTKNKKVNI